VTPHPRLAAAVALLLATGSIAACGSDEPESAAGDPESVERALTGAPPPLRKLHRQANELLGGGARAFRERLAELEGHPVVVNKWASWCPPCRAEFPFFQRQSVRRGKEIAFIGVDSGDNDADARKFLKEFPVSYPSYKDPDLKVAAVFKGLAAFPATAFYDAKGRLAFVHQGGYATERQLADDIERYAR
jgi:cytochrome c biogenesis protein CcmG/thiol:disulfide interchange protein DsbE